jgi:hypothetical protein
MFMSRWVSMTLPRRRSAYRDWMRSGAVLRVAVAVGACLLVALTSAAVPAAPATQPRATTVASAPPAPAHQVTTATRLSFRLPDIDGAVYTPNARNIAMRSVATGPLLLFLPATGHVPRDYRAFLNTASSLGYHVLALDYWNLGLSVARTCGGDPHCYGDVQANRFDGRSPGRFSAVRPSDSILARLTHSLRMLRERDPNGGWQRYLTGDHVRWNRIVLAGHSQGGGESAWIANRHVVQGVLMFASPVAVDGAVVASWMSDHGATPTSRYYGFDDIHDVYFKRIQGSWAALGVGGIRPPLRIGSSLPLGGGHRILSRVQLGTPGQAHGRIVADDGPRTASGVPVFQPVWRWMLSAVREPPAA